MEHAAEEMTSLRHNVESKTESGRKPRLRLVETLVISAKENVSREGLEEED